MFLVFGGGSLVVEDGVKLKWLVCYYFHADAVAFCQVIEKTKNLSFRSTMWLGSRVRLASKIDKWLQALFIC